MPFIPPASIARSVSGLTAKERPVDNTSSTSTRVQRGDRGGSVTERLASNLKQLGKKSQPRSHLPTATAASGTELQAKRRERLLPSSQTDSFPASSSGESLSKTPQRHKHVKSEPEVKTRVKRQEEVRFTLTLTPDAVLLLQRRNSERRQRSASRNTASGGGGGVSGGASESRRRKDNVSKRTAVRHGAPSGRVAAKNDGDTEDTVDITSILKISLLNERHKYDDVEYEEEEEDRGVDERVLLKCTEWLRGLENTPVTVGRGMNKSMSGMKSL